MAEIPRRRIKELLARYELEPELQDIFVEGLFDKELLESVAKSAKTTHRFYEIDTVDIPITLLSDLGLTEGNKQRVIALALKLEEIECGPSVRCLVDKDLDHWTGSTVSCSCLKHTTYCSLECHFIDPIVAQNILLSFGRVRIDDAGVFFESIAETLKCLFALRLAFADQGIQAKWIDLKKYLSASKSGVSLDLPRFKCSMAQANSCHASLAVITTSYERWLSILSKDPRCAARGHDYSSLLAFSAMKLGKVPSGWSHEFVERLFLLQWPNSEVVRQELLAYLSE